MSELREKEQGVGDSCQEKLAPPKSLREGGGRAEIVWDMIAKRYPNAAPLLCEMEVVIERAESLLQQLRSGPYENEKEIGSSSSTHISDEQSTSSSMESSSMSEEINDEVEVGTNISEERIAKIEEPSTSISSTSSQEIEQKESVNSHRELTSTDESINLDAVREFPVEKSVQKEEYRSASNFQKPEVKRDSAVSMRLRESLEGWEKVAVGKIENSEKIKDKKETSIGRYDRSGPSENSTIHEATRVEISSLKLPRNICEEKTIRKIGNAMREPKTTTRKSLKTETVLPPKRRTKVTSDSSPNRVEMTNLASTPVWNKEVEKIRRNEKQKKGSGDENSPKSSTRSKTAMDILMDYAKQIEKPIQFIDVPNKMNEYSIKCSFAGWSAESFGNNESAVKNKVATEILRMIAEVQIDEQDMKGLTLFTDDQMQCIVALGTGNQPENAMRKLYKLCLEKNAPKPVYSTRKGHGFEGIKHSAECKALGKVGYGNGIRDVNAKISAAEDLLTKLFPEHCS